MSGSQALEGSEPLGMIVSEDLFNWLLCLEVRKAQRLRYCLSLIRLTLTDPGVDHISSVYVAESVIRKLRSTDVATAMGRSSIAMLLIDAEPLSLPAIVDRLVPDLQVLTGDAATPPRRIWSAGGACYPRTAADATDLFDQASDLMQQAQTEGGNRLYIATLRGH